MKSSAKACNTNERQGKTMMAGKANERLIENDPTARKKERGEKMICSKVRLDLT